MYSEPNFIILDAARIAKDWEETRALNTSGRSLYRGDKNSEILSTVAPHLFDYSGDTTFAKHLYKRGWAGSWGIFLYTRETFEMCYRHLRRFLMVKMETGKQVYFRFYDPRVLRIFLPTCDKNQLIDFFGPIDYFLVEDEDKEYAVHFSHEFGVLKQQRIKASELFGEPAATNTPN